jgi:hypothetical protein
LASTDQASLVLPQVANRLASSQSYLEMLRRLSRGQQRTLIMALNDVTRIFTVLDGGDDAATGSVSIAPTSDLRGF